MVVGSAVEERDTVVIGAGPGGYVAALRLGQLKKDVLLIDKRGFGGLGGVCLQEGCIPSKAFLSAARVGYDFLHAQAMGWSGQNVKNDFKKLQEWKRERVKKLSSGILALCKKNHVEFLQGTAAFESSNRVRLESEHESRPIEFKRCILDTGSAPNAAPQLPVDHQTVLDSTSALALDELPSDLAVIGAGSIGIEMATFFAKLGTNVSVIQRGPRILTSMEKDVADVVQRRLEKLGVHVFLDTTLDKAILKKSQAELQLVSKEKKIRIADPKSFGRLGA